MNPRTIHLVASPDDNPRGHGGERYRANPFVRARGAGRNVDRRELRWGAQAADLLTRSRGTISAVASPDLP